MGEFHFIVDLLVIGFRRNPNGTSAGRRRRTFDGARPLLLHDGWVVSLQPAQGAIGRDGDGKSDILGRSDNGDVSAWLMNGTQKVADQLVSHIGNDWLLT